MGTVETSDSDPIRLPLSVEVEVKKVERMVVDDTSVVKEDPAFVKLPGEAAVIETIVEETSPFPAPDRSPEVTAEEPSDELDSLSEVVTASSVVVR
jgi:hypothetical protein